MNTRSLFALGLLGLALFGTGFWAGWQRHSGPGSGAPAGGDPATQGSDNSKLQAVARDDGENQATSGGKLALPALINKIQTMRASALGSDKEWQVIEQSLAPSDVRKVLEALKKNPSKEVQRMLTYKLLSFWAGSEPLEAIGYAGSLSGTQEHEQAVLAVLNGWAEKDPQAAADWAR